MTSWAGLLLLGASLAAGGPELVHATRVAMGTVFEIAAYDESRPRAARAIAEALAEVERLDALLSDYLPDSELRRASVAARGGPVRVSPELYEVLSFSLRYARLSGGVFDPTIKPLVRAWKSGEPPGRAEQKRLRSCVGWRKLTLLPPDRIRIDSDCLELDLGAVGKGYAVDRAAAVLAGAGLRRALVSAGSSTILALRPPPGADGWEVDLPRGAGSITLSDSSISVSEQAGRHIVDPTTGLPSASSLAVAVVAPTATASDALATTLLVLGTEKGARLLSEFPGTTVRWIDEKGRIRP